MPSARSARAVIETGAAVTGGDDGLIAVLFDNTGSIIVGGGSTVAVLTRTPIVPTAFTRKRPYANAADLSTKLLENVDGYSLG